MKQILILLRHSYKWDGKDFIIILIATIMAGIVTRFFTLNFLIEGGIIAVLFVKSIYFYWMHSFIPSSQDSNGFSWKYLQSLPLNKKDLVNSILVVSFYSTLPFLIWFITFHEQIIKELFNYEKIHFLTTFKFLLSFIIFNVLFSLSRIRSVITLPRRQFAHSDKKAIFYYQMAVMLLGVVILIYSSSIAIELQRREVLNSLELFLNFLKFIVDVFKSYYIFPIAFLSTYLLYESLIKIWQNEEISYRTLKYSIKKSKLMIATCSSLLLIGSQIFDFNTPDRYLGSNLNVAVFKNDVKQVKLLIDNGEELNSSNKHKFYPLKVAAREGNIELFKFLIKHGAKLDLKDPSILTYAIHGNSPEIVKYLLDKEFDPNFKSPEFNIYPVHLAAVRCNLEMLDALVEKGADIHKVNHLGSTALHLAAKSKCSMTIAALLELGVDPSIKDQKEKIAKDYIGKSDKYAELIHYFNKKTRQPASEK